MAGSPLSCGILAVMSDELATPDLLERTRRSFAAANRGDWDEVMSFFAPEAVWEVLGLQAFDGPDAIRGFLEDWVGTFEDADIEVEELQNLGGGVTFVIATLDGRLAGSTAQMRVRFGATYRWAGEAIVQIASYTSVDEARTAAERLAGNRG